MVPPLVSGGGLCPMKVALLGTGGIGLGYAALLHDRGLTPVLWSPSGKGTEAFRAGEELVAEGALAARFRPDIADDASFVRDCELVVVTVPAYGYCTIFDQVLAHMRAESIIVISAHLSLAALSVSRRLKDQGLRLPVVAWGTTALMGRRTGPASVDIGGLRKQVDMATTDSLDGERGLSVCTAAFGERFKLAHDLMSIQLGNISPVVHLANALCNLTRIEKGEVWSQYGAMTPAVARLIEALDRERLAVAQAYGVDVKSVSRHVQMTFGFDDGMPLAAMAKEVDRKRGGKPPGPRSLDTRFVLEDVPFGIVPLVRLARRVDVPVPVHDAGLTLMNALYGRDFSKENDVFDASVLDNA